MKATRHILLLAFLAPSLSPAEAPPDFTFFESKVRPLLVEHCYECHSSDAKKLRGELYLDSRPGWTTGGDSGPPILPGDPEGSLLVHAIRYGDPDLEMPPKQKLPQAKVDILEKWISMGAPDPRDQSPALRSPEGEEWDLEEGRKFWSFQPLANPPLPEVRDRDWPRNAIDRFILARLESEDLTPDADADPATLNRRLHIDLTGLPPSPKETSTLEIIPPAAGSAKSLRSAPESGEPLRGRSSQNSKFGVQEKTQRLLSSKAYAERFARHWLDLARYADSTGSGASKLLPDAHKYRDWVVNAFATDLPYNEFATAQLAGDLIPSANTGERYDNLAATAFLVLGPRNYINDDEEAFRMDGADEQLDTVGRVFLGMTLGCARCHDHKFDPVPMVDYYALAGIFTSTETSDPIPATTNFRWNEVADPNVDPTGESLRAYEKAFADYRILTRKWSKARTDSSVTPDQLEALNAERLAAQKALPKKPAVLMGAADGPRPADEPRRVRGNPHQNAEVVPRGFLQVALAPDTPPPAIANNESGRRELAAWITSPDNPLTTRVYVNRVWAHLMGRGLVPTLDNFGTTGELPTHPELLDWLSSWFVNNDQSTKKLVTLITGSRTYRLGPSRKDSPLLEQDPANHLFGRRVRRSLDAETLRDSILATSLSLDLETTGRPFPSKLKNEFTYNFDDDHRRSLYLPRFRNNLPELFETFDVANPATVVGKRDLTILSPQALYLMNNPFVRRESERAARNLLAQTLPIKDTIQLAFQSTLSRPPSKKELNLALNFLDTPPPADETEHAQQLQRWTDFQQNLFSTVDFRFYR